MIECFDCETEVRWPQIWILMHESGTAPGTITSSVASGER